MYQVTKFKKKETFTKRELVFTIAYFENGSLKTLHYFSDANIGGFKDKKSLWCSIHKNTI